MVQQASINGKSISQDLLVVVEEHGQLTLSEDMVEQVVEVVDRNQVHQLGTANTGGGGGGADLR